LLFPWIASHVLLGVVAAILCKRRLYRKFPCFLAYAVYEIAKTILLFALYSVVGLTSELYAYAFSATLMFSIALRFGVIDEVSKDLFRESQFVKVAARRLLRGGTGLLLVVAVLFTIYAPGNNKLGFVAGILVVNRGAAMVQCGLLLALLLSRFLGLPWRRPAFGITLGLGILTSVDLATYALRAEFTSRVGAELLNLLITGTYLVCVSIWIGYLLAPEARPVSLAVLPRDEVETWNREFQHLLKD